MNTSKGWADVKNIKISLNLAGACLDWSDRIKKLCVKPPNNSFFVLRDIFVYTIFFKGHVNVTKIPSESVIDSAVNKICCELMGLQRPLAYKIDNITVSGQLTGCTFINLNDIGHSVQVCPKNILKVNLNLEKFPGLFLRHILGTILLFDSRKFVFVGVKKIKHIKPLFNWLTENVLSA